MTKNTGTLDRVIRLLIAVLYLTHVISGVAAVVLGIVAGGFVITSLVGFCPLYVPLKISTRKQLGVTQLGRVRRQGLPNTT